jgi:lysophospholipase L1-like esterase
MRRLPATVLLLGLLLPGPLAAAEPCPPAPAQAIRLPATRAALEHGRAVTIVAFGSSSTEGSGASGPAMTYPALLAARLKAALPGRPVSVLNRGRGGEDVGEMTARLETDVLAARPTLVIWQTGANAVLRGIAPETFAAMLAGGIDRLRAAGADVVLMDSQRAPQLLDHPGFGRIDAAIRGLAETLRVPLFSRAALMEAWAAAGTPHAAMLAPDGLHHNDRGYACVTEALARSVLDAAGPARVAGR